MKIKRDHQRIIYQKTSIDKFNKTQNKLAMHNIEFDTKIDGEDYNRLITVGQEIGAPIAENMDLSKIYTVCIQNKDIGKAREALNEKE